MTTVRSFSTVLTGALLALALHSGASAKKGEEHWSALSTTAISITGDILLSPTRLNAAGHDFPLKVATDLPDYGAFFGSVPARVLRVTGKMNPKMLNGNRFGCRSPVDWIVVYRFDHGTKLGMDVFSGPDSPTTDTDPGMCATYTYVRP
jgi:hypothetical protein